VDHRFGGRPIQDRDPRFLYPGIILKDIQRIVCSSCIKYQVGYIHQVAALFSDHFSSVFATDLYINKLDAGLATLSIAKGDPFKLTSPAQHAMHR